MFELWLAALTFGAGLLVSLLATPIVILLARRLPALERAEPAAEERELHARPMPRLGGVAVMAGFLGGVIAALILSGYSGSLFGAARYHWIGWIGGIGLLFGCGLVDDLRGLGPATKFAMQTLAGLLVIAAGFQIDYVSLPGLGIISLGWATLPLSLVWIVGVTNAINLIDGLDGLAAGIGFLITATMAIIASYQGVFPVAVIAVALAGSLLGFLPYNFSPARIFLGDSGSQFLGFTLAVISIRGMQKSTTIVAILVPILLLGLPILDTLLVVLRRGWRIHTEPAGQSGLWRRLVRSGGVFRGDREHIHHNLLELGLSHRKAVAVLYIAAAIFCAAAIGLVALRNALVAILVAGALALATMVVKLTAVRRRVYRPPRVVAAVRGGGERRRGTGSPPAVTRSGREAAREGR